MTIVIGQQQNEKSNGDNAIYLLLDRSASMSGQGWEEVIDSVNNYVDKLEGNPTVNIYAFDSNFDNNDILTLLRETTKDNYQPISSTEVTPRGSTPLYDAACAVLDKMLDANPKKALFITMTDGEENTSKIYALTDVKERLGKIEEKDWPAIFLGAGFKEVEKYTAATFAVKSSNIANFSVGNRVRGMDLVATKSVAYFNSAVGASADTMNFTDEEKKELNNE